MHISITTVTMLKISHNIFKTYFAYCEKRIESRKSARNGNYPCPSNTELEASKLELLLTVHTMPPISLQWNFENSLGVTKFNKKHVYCVEYFSKIIHYCKVMHENVVLLVGHLVFLI